MASVAFFALSLLFAPVDLHRSPKVGAKVSYSLRATLGAGEQDAARYSGKITEEVKSVNGDSFVTESVAKIDVEILGTVQARAPHTSARTEKLDGTLVAAGRIDPLALFSVGRVDRLRGLYFPTGSVNVGDGWWHLGKADDSLKGGAFSSYGKLVGEEKVNDRDTWKLSVDAREVDVPDAIHVKGMVYLDKADGSLVWGQWQIEGFVAREGDPAATARVELKRVD